MLIPYLLKKGSFRPKFDVWVTERKREINEGVKLRVNLGKTGGYPAENLEITISQHDQNFFETDWEYKDWTRFPARIRALATSLKDQDLWGKYLTSHIDGEIELRKVSN